MGLVILGWQSYTYIFKKAKTSIPNVVSGKLLMSIMEFGVMFTFCCILFCFTFFCKGHLNTASITLKKKKNPTKCFQREKGRYTPYVNSYFFGLVLFCVCPSAFFSGKGIVLSMTVQCPGAKETAKGEATPFAWKMDTRLRGENKESQRRGRKSQGEN